MSSGSKGAHSCSHAQSNTLYNQTIDELEFERGIWTAAINGDLEKVQTIIDKDQNDVNKRDKNGYTALHYASRAGHTSVCELLLRNGADVNAQLNSGDTALHRASYMGRVEVVQLLVRYKAEPYSGAGGQTPLHKAVDQSRMEVAQVLVCRYPGLVRAEDNEGRRPIDLYYKSASVAINNERVTGEVVALDPSKTAYDSRYDEDVNKEWVSLLEPT